jgi:ABC-type dipeptide/oligopeptide/nickel transport system permease component
MKKSTFSIILLVFAAVPTIILAVCVALIFDIELPAFESKGQYSVSIPNETRASQPGNVRLSDAEVKYLVANATSKTGGAYRGFIGGFEYWVYSR